MSCWLQCYSVDSWMGGKGFTSVQIFSLCSHSYFPIISFHVFFFLYFLTQWGFPQCTFLSVMYFIIVWFLSIWISVSDHFYFILTSETQIDKGKIVNHSCAPFFPVNYPRARRRMARHGYVCGDFLELVLFCFNFRDHCKQKRTNTQVSIFRVANQSNPKDSWCHICPQLLHLSIVQRFCWGFRVTSWVAFCVGT